MKFYTCIFLIFAINAFAQNNTTVNNSDSTITEHTIAETQNPETESVDDLFTAPKPDAVITDANTDHLQQYTKDEKIKFSGSFITDAGFGFGWSDWPVFSNLKQGFFLAVGAIAKFNLNLDIRPSSDAYIHAAVTTSLDPSKKLEQWVSFNLIELFADYTAADTVFFRVGKFSQAWGQGLLFGSDINIVRDMPNSFAFKASIPTWLDGVSAVAYINSEFFPLGVENAVKNTAFGLKLDKVLWETFFSIAARYQVKSGVDVLFSIKRTLWTVDFFNDTVLHYKSKDFYAKTLFGFFKEWQDIKLYGEYYYDGSLTSASLPHGGHSLGLVCGYNNVGGSPVDLGLDLRYGFANNVGSVTFGLVWPFLKYLKLKVGLPLIYGKDLASSEMPKALKDLLNIHALYNKNYRLAIIIGVSLQINF